ncbi:hypothetical protein BH09VER1_BH09VER1_34700 [soil metagenome]
MNSLRSFFLCILPVAVASLSTLVAADQSVIVPCDQPVKSKKRGVCLNEASAQDFMALSPSVSWYYTWHYTDTNHAPDAAKITFIPMAWGNRAADIRGLDEYLSNHKVPQVLAINEPNLRGQAFIDPKTTAELYQKIKAVADKHGVPIVGPNMALGSGGNESIKAMDPIENKEVTYTFQNPFLKAFLFYMGKTDVPALGTHTYGALGELQWLVDMMPKEFNRPVWVTEFANWHATSPEEEMDYMIQAVDLMERLPRVGGYAWFKERVKDNPKISLLDKSGVLTPLGAAYVKMPVHDPDVFYRLPGRLQLESYTAMDKAELAQTKDAEGFLEMKVSDANAWLDYQVFSDRAQNYTANLRASTAEGTVIELKSGDKSLAKFTGTTRGWQTITAPLALPAGKSTLRLISNGPARLNWLEFSAR